MTLAIELTCAAVIALGLLVWALACRYDHGSED